jgi:transcriptional regulator with XRE-family HTH domain
VGDDSRIGERVRQARGRRTQAEVARVVGRTQGWLSRVERGVIPLDSRRTVDDLARALGVSPVDITGQPYRPAGPDHTKVHAAVPAIRRVILDPPGRPSRTVPELAAALDALHAAFERFELEVCARIAPSLLAELLATANTAARQEVLPLLTWTLVKVQSMLKDAGYGDLALLAAEMGDSFAAESGDRVLIGAAAFEHAHTLACISVGAYRGAWELADRAADDARGPGDEVLAIRGSLHLAAAWAAACVGQARPALDRIGEAARIARRVEPGTAAAWHLVFGVPNAALHQVSVAVEAGDASLALAAAEHVVPAELPIFRRSLYYSDLGRVLAKAGRDEAALRAFRQAEAMAPLRLRLHPLAREAVADMLTRPHPVSTGRELRGLAYRMRIAH